MIICAGLAIGAVSLLYTNRMARHLREKEQHDVEVWAHAMERANRDALNDFMSDPLLADIISSHQNIPFIITDENLEALQ